MKTFYNALKKSYVALVLFFLYAPIFFLVVFSFNGSKTMGNWTGFTFKWYGELFADTVIMEALFNTLTIATISAIVATVIGTIAAIGISNMGKRSKMIVLNCSYLPVVNPDIVTGVSLMLLFLFLNIQRGYMTLLLAHITFNIPYVIFSVLPKIKQMPTGVFEAALDLGAKPYYALKKIVLPLIMPGIITGFLFAFTLSLDDFVISFFTTQGVNTLPITVYAMAKRGISPKINALSTIIFVCVVVLLIIINVKSNRGKKKGEV